MDSTVRRINDISVSTRFTMSRPALAAFLYAAVLPAVQARCFFRDDDDDDDDDECVNRYSAPTIRS